MLRTGFALVSLALLAFTASDADAGKQKKKKAHHLKGTIESVEAGKEAGHGTIIVKVHGKKGAAATEKKIHVNKKTDIEDVVGKKKNKSTKAGSFADLKAGAHVNVTLRGGTEQAEKIVVSLAKKKKKAA